METDRDTIHLLKECDAGTKMAVTSIEEVFDKIHDPSMKQLLSESKSHHEKLGNDLHELLNRHNSEEKEPSLMARGMSWLKTNMKITMDEADSTIADLLTDGCNMGVKSLHKYLNQYKDADNTSKEICRKLVTIEEQLCRDLRDYL